MPRRRDIGVAEPLLHLGDSGLKREGARRRRGTQGVSAEAIHLGTADDIAIDRGRIGRGSSLPVRLLGHRTEHGAGGVGGSRMHQAPQKPFNA